jgi:hypothetical protein
MWQKPSVVVLWYYTNIHFGGLKNVRDTAGFTGTEAGTFQILTRSNCQSTELFSVHEWTN